MYFNDFVFFFVMLAAFASMLSGMTIAAYVFVISAAAYLLYGLYTTDIRLEEY